MHGEKIKVKNYCCVGLKPLHLSFGIGQGFV